MAFLNLCADDQLVKTLHQIFKANIVRIPEKRILPLTVIALKSGKPSYWGPIQDLIPGIPDLSGNIKPSRLADISGTRSKSVNSELGLKILSGFLEGFSLPSASITAKFSGADKISFSFQEVIRNFIAPARLGTLLKDSVVDPDHPSNTIFFKDKAKLFIIDSVITSKDFSIRVDSSKNSEFTLDLPNIEKIANAKGNVKVNIASDLELTFKGDDPLTFAFTCLLCDLDLAGRLSLQPGGDHLSFAKSNEPTNQLLYAEPGMIEW